MLILTQSWFTESVWFPRFGSFSVSKVPTLAGGRPSGQLMVENMTLSPDGLTSYSLSFPDDPTKCLTRVPSPTGLDGPSDPSDNLQSRSVVLLL